MTCLFLLGFHFDWIAGVLRGCVRPPGVPSGPHSLVPKANSEHFANGWSLDEVRRVVLFRRSLCTHPPTRLLLPIGMLVRLCRLNYCRLFGVFCGFRSICRGNDYWSKQGINGPKPIPIFGNIINTLMTSEKDRLLGYQKKYGKIYGHYMGDIPVLSIADPELIKLILVKDFHVFTGRHIVWSAKTAIRSRNITQLCGDDWKRVRTIVSPVFRSGKMRLMCPQIKQCLTSFMSYLDVLAEKRQELDMIDTFTKFSLDVVNTTIFATNIDVYKSPTDGDTTREHPFVLHAREKFTYKGWKEMATLVLPNFALKFIRLADSNVNKYFEDYVRHLLKGRRDNPSKNHQDFLQMLMDAEVTDRKPGDGSATTQDNSESHHVNQDEESLAVERKVMDIKVRDKRLSEDEIVAQGFIMVQTFAGTSSALAHTAYEFALNPDCQRRLRDEITDAISAATGEIAYDVLARLPYLDAVVSETLRIHGKPSALFRYTSADYKLGDTGITLKSGQQIEIPVYAIHMSDENYPNAFKYDPDRFMPENKHLIKPYTYLPFGGGPRNCVGMRLGLLEMKLCLAHMVLKYQFVRTPKTDVPLQYQRSVKMVFPKRVFVGIEKIA
ncbi:unnamed protein product [Oppiella nova]|uniref:Cytochrome P450 n=1 Tax=Oppiella nova TaxID=334625 RepID=A0A7R9LNV1_9ACAR|nr:unnamed protein product [Oppiella nova]CAG2165508.1 unnamed protein product [Oppiella nova]